MRPGPVLAAIDLTGLADWSELGRDGEVLRYGARLGGRPVLVSLRPRTAGIEAMANALAAAVALPPTPALAPLLGSGVHEDACWHVQGRPDGERLDRLLAGPAPAAADGLGWCLDLCRALEVLHGAGIAHRGIGPAAVWCTGERAVLADVGVFADGGDPSAATVRAPEQLLGEAGDGRCDIHAVGVLLLRIVTGAWPVVVRNRADLDAWARSPLPESLFAGLAPGMAAVLRRALARHADDRYPTATPLREDLERLAHGFSPLHARPAGGGARAPGMTTIEHQRRQSVAGAASTVVPVVHRGSRWPLVAGGIAVTGAVIAAFALGAGSTPPAAPPQTAPPPVSAVAPSAPPVRPAGPAWAGTTGEDAHGPWADLPVVGRTLRLRRIAAAPARIGSPADEPGRQANETPFEAALSTPVWMLDREVDQALYRAVTGTNPSLFPGDDLPVENLTWDDATAFCLRLEALVPGLGARLPTEVEWEIACRAGGEGPFAVERMWDAASAERTRPVAILPANTWGLYDLHGNVMEWTVDAFAPYPSRPVVDRRIASGAQRVARGGAWSTERVDTRAARRFGLMGRAHLPYLGFRFVASDTGR
jgi:sulfatase modifying factor 1